jgi:hypothetical protein
MEEHLAAEAEPGRARMGIGIAAEEGRLKKTMQVLHTAGVPPSRGRIILPTIGCMTKSRVAETNSVNA